MGRRLRCLRPRTALLYGWTCSGERVAVSILHMAGPGDKRNDTSARVPGVDERPVCHPACHLAWDGLRVVFSELSKLLNQEYALGTPGLKHFRNYFEPIKTARCGFPWEKTTKTFDVTFTFAITEVITPTSADAFPGG